MRTYRQHIRSVAELESFDPYAFHEDKRFPQQLCDFVLSLALVFNDLRNIMLAHEILETVAPPNRLAIMPEVGEFNGITLHLFRTNIAIVHELTVLIEENKRALRHHEFGEILRKLTRRARDSWAAVVAATEGKGPGRDPLAKFLFFARNKVAFHYDGKEISRGYSRAFLRGSKREPFVSRGQTLATSRFYFADAAAEDYLREVGDPATDEVFALGTLKLVRNVTFSIHEIVLTFITARGFAWREPAA